MPFVLSAALYESMHFSPAEQVGPTKACSGSDEAKVKVVRLLGFGLSIQRNSYNRVDDGDLSAKDV